jgi:Zn-dependent oligopeptidase
MGADLTPEQIKRKAQIDEELLKLEKEFEQRLMTGHNTWQLVVTDAAELRGLPESWMNAAAANAEAAGIEQPAWVLTLADNTAEAALVFCENEETRRKCWLGYNGGGTKHQIDTEDILHRTFELRHELAQMMGFRHFADMQAEQRMTGTAEKAVAFVDGMLAALKPAFDAEMATYLKNLEKAKGSPLAPLQPWNVFYYTQRLADEPGMSPALVMPYLPMESVLSGMMQIWSKMLEVEFEERQTACVKSQSHPADILFLCGTRCSGYRNSLQCQFFFQQAVLAAQLGENFHVRGDVHDVVVEQVLVLLLGSGFQILQAGDGLRCHILIGNTALLQPDVLAQNPAEHGQTVV